MTTGRTITVRLNDKEIKQLDDALEGTNLTKGRFIKAALKSALASPESVISVSHVANQRKLLNDARAEANKAIDNLQKDIRNLFDDVVLI